VAFSTLLFGEWYQVWDIIKKLGSWAWWYMPVIPSLQKLRPKDHGFKNKKELEYSFPFNRWKHC
jgi:hypothetical protein